MAFRRFFQVRISKQEVRTASFRLLEDSGPWQLIAQLSDAAEAHDLWRQLLVDF